MPRMIDDPTLTRLLGSIAKNDLVLLCGTGVSIASPSNRLPARQVVQIRYDKCRSVEDLAVRLQGRHLSLGWSLL